jgi:hypothetical protein
MDERCKHAVLVALSAGAIGFCLAFVAPVPLATANLALTADRRLVTSARLGDEREPRPTCD